MKSEVDGTVAAAWGSEAWSCTGETRTWAIDADGRTLDTRSVKVTEARLRSPDCWTTGSNAGVVWGVLPAGALLPKVLLLLPVGFCGTSSSSSGSSIIFCEAANESTARSSVDRGHD